MKTSTIHTSAPSRIVELRSETGRALLHVGHHVVSVQFIADMLHDRATTVMQ